MNVNDYFETSDLGLVATLILHGAKIDALDRKSSRAIFYLRREKGLDQLVQAFWAHELRVDPVAYSAALKEAKTRLYNGDIY